MKKQDLNSRRNFLNALVLGTAASGLSMLSNGLNAALPINAEVDLNDAEKWMKNLKGKHRIVYDGSTPHDGFPFMWVYAFGLIIKKYKTNKIKMGKIKLSIN